MTMQPSTRESLSLLLRELKLPVVEGVTYREELFPMVVFRRDHHGAGGVPQVPRGSRTRLLGHLARSIFSGSPVLPVVVEGVAHREEVFPTVVSRRLSETQPGTEGDLDYLRVLHLAASTMESEVGAALELLLGGLPSSNQVEALAEQGEVA